MWAIEDQGHEEGRTENELKSLQEPYDALDLYGKHHCDYNQAKHLREFD